MKNTKTWLTALLAIAAGIIILYLLQRDHKGLNKKLSTNRNIERQNDGPALRLRHDFLMMRDPMLNRVPTERLIPAKQIMEEISLVDRAENTTALTWQERGPDNIGGRTRALLVDRSDVTGNTVFAGGVGGGLWKTTNFKSTATWTVINDFFSNIAITCIKQSPTNASEIYFGTGEGWGNYDAIEGLGIWKSVDGGSVWTQLTSTATISYVNDLEFDNNGYLYAATRSTDATKRGIIRSTDGGSTWVQVLADPDPNVTTRGADLERAADGDMYATLGIFTVGHIFRSASNGTSTGIAGSWSEITAPGITSNDYQRTEIAICPNLPDRIYAIAQNDAAPNGIGAMYRSDNDGLNWSTLTNASWCDQGITTNSDFSRGQAWYDLIMAVDPANSNTVLAGGVVVVKSTNSGTAWSQMTRWTTAATCTTAPVIHADIHEIIFLSSSELIICTDGGIYYSTDGGASFTAKNTGYNVTQYYGLAVHPGSGSNIMIGGTQDNGSHLFNAAGINTVTSVSGGDGGFCFIDETNGSVWMTSYPGGYFNVYRNSGATFLGTAGSGDGRFVSVGDYADGLNILYYGDADGLYGRLINVESGTASYGTVNISTEMGANRQVSSVKVDPADETTIWLGCSDSETNFGAPATPLLLKVIRANNSTGGPPNTRPEAIVFAGPVLAAGSYISSIDIESGNSNHLLITVSNYGVNSVWESTDGGINWTSIEGNLPDMPIRWGMFIPAGYSGRSASVGGVILATELGVWTTSTLNGGSTSWIANNQGLANVRADQVVLRSSDKLVAVATHGRGLYTANLLTQPLPVVLTSFTGQLQQNAILLKWITSSENNSKHFELERSRDGNNFQRIAIIPAAGYSNVAINYQYKDLEKPLEKNYYRLKSVDLDGSSKFSQVVLIQVKDQDQDILVFGNPFRESLRIGFFRSPASRGELRLYDMIGHLVARQEFEAGNQEIVFNLKGARLPNGSYILNAIVDGKKLVQIVQKE